MPNQNIMLSPRLHWIAEQIEENEKYADIGSDHAQLPVHVSIKKPSTQAIVGEINQGPLINAKETIAKNKLQNQIEARLGDGLKVLKSEDQLDTIVIAGMGGKLITRILQEGLQDLNHHPRLILQPNNNEHEVRKYLYQNQYKINREVIVKDKEIYYEIMVAVKTDKPAQHTYRDLVFGPCLRKVKPKFFVEKWQAELAHLKKVVEQMKKSKMIDTIKINQFTQRIKEIEEEIS